MIFYFYVYCKGSGFKGGASSLFIIKTYYRTTILGLLALCPRIVGILGRAESPGIYTSAYQPHFRMVKVNEYFWQDYEA
jgi:hypothetical protein